MKSNIFTLLFSAFALFSCNIQNPDENPTEPENQAKIEVTQDVALDNYKGNGVQWGGYDFLEYYTSSKKISAADWTKIAERVSFMKPGLVRMMFSQQWNYSPTGDPSVSNEVIVPILDFCQANGITVTAGEWGHHGGNTIDDAWLQRSVDYIDWLVNTKGYSCIKHFIMVNEPNGNWSSINANFSLWQTLMEKTHAKMSEKGLLSKVELMGPDIAYWNATSATSYNNWLINTKTALDDKLGAYDVHAYPGQKYIREEAFSYTLREHKKLIPTNKEVFMMELGCKYADEPILNAENERRKKAKPNTGNDANMFVYDAFYAIDIADAMIQCMTNGYSGITLWNLDDAMYCAYTDNGTPNGLQRWGMWNSLGEELGDAADENIRPWFYTTSLLCRYFPVGSKIYKVTSSNKNVRAIAAEKNGKYTIAIVNSSLSVVKNTLVAMDVKNMTNVKVYKYTSLEDAKFIGTTDAKGLPTPAVTENTIDFSKGYAIETILPLSFVLITNM